MTDMHKRAAILAMACLTAACYNYAPLATPNPEPGTYLAVTLSDAGSYAMTRYLGPDVFVVRGRYLGTDERGLLVSVASIELHRGWEESWRGETVALPAATIASVEVRRPAKHKTLLLAGAGAGGIVAAVAVFALTGGGTAPTDQVPRPVKK